MPQQGGHLADLVLQIIQGAPAQGGAGDAHRDVEMPDQPVGDGPRVMDRETRERMLNIFRKHSPPHYKGGRDPIAALEWLQEMERIFQVMECDADMKLLYSVYMLQGDAADWWTNVRAPLECQGYAITWPLFERHFLDRYFPEEVREKKKSEFEDLKQGNMTIDEYLSKFNMLAKYSCYGRGPLTPEDKAFRFKRGLNDMIAGKLAGHCTRDFVTLIKQCQDIQEYYRTRGKGAADQSFSRKVTSWNGKSKGLQVKQGEFKNRNGRTGNGKTPTCAECGRSHLGVCRMGQNVCFTCGQSGHVSRRCPKKKSQAASIHVVATSIIIEEPPVPPDE